MERSSAEMLYEIDSLHADIATLEQENMMLRARNQRLMAAFDHVERTANYLLEQIRKDQS